MLEGYSLAERQANLGVPAVTVAVALDGEIVWSAGYGPGVAADTVFQAASLSKPVAAVAILELARRRGIDPDADIAPLLTDIDVAAMTPSGFTVTLRKLLSHTAGATPGGFAGYAPGVDLPDNREVILGSPRTNSPPVTISPDPESPLRYGGGGFQLAQAVAEEVSNASFAAMLDAFVLAPAGMDDSSFAQPPEADFLRSHSVAIGHMRGPVPLPGGWHVFPEQAAAGLWTTAEDYLRFGLALMAAADGEDRGISPEVAEIMLAGVPGMEDIGVGIGIERDADGVFAISHSGSNPGYRALFIGFPRERAGIVILTNSDSGGVLAQEIVAGARAVYGWPGGAVRRVVEVPLPPAELAVLAGIYLLPDRSGPAFAVEVRGARLAGRTGTGIPFELVPLGGGRFIDPDDGQEILFVIDADGTSARIGEDRYPLAE